ncbi:MAG: helix-turn-helix transcriptional regulator [Thermoleophilia bacterium]|nr:helix-turn-helix transcriptional regulator [Thermoleophilia bacterium]
MNRLEQNRTQRSVATDAGISRRTLVRLEAGEDVSLITFIRVLRELNLLDNLSNLIPEPAPSPIERLKTQGKRRRRAS